MAAAFRVRILFIGLGQLRRSTTSRDRVRTQNDCLPVVPCECYCIFTRIFNSRNRLNWFPRTRRTAHFRLVSRIIYSGIKFIWVIAPGPQPPCHPYLLLAVVQILVSLAVLVILFVSFHFRLETQLRANGFHRVTLAEGVK